jgi:hypothetical protein
VKSIPDRGWWRRKTTNRELMWEHCIKYLIAAFEDDKGVRFIEHHDTISFIFDDEVLMRVKKADHRLCTSNVQTELSEEFHEHDKDLFGYSGLQRVYFVYVPNRFETKIDWIGVVAYEGERSIWHYEILDVPATPVIEFPKATPKPAKALAKLKIVPTKKRTESEDDK